jgi:hypothetical protein
MYDKFAPLLEQALTEPGIVSAGFPPVSPLQHWQPDSGGHPAPTKVSAPVAHRELQSLEGAGSVRLQGTESAVAVDADHRQTSGRASF